MITIILGALLDASPALQRLADQKLPYAAAYRVTKIANAVAAELDHFNKARDALITELGTVRPTTVDERARGLGATTSAILPTSPDWDVFLARVRELAAVAADLAVAPFDPASVPSLEISAADIRALGPLLKGNADGE